jgi:hypothetical protein
MRRVVSGGNAFGGVTIGVATLGVLLCHCANFRLYCFIEIDYTYSRLTGAK